MTDFLDRTVRLGFSALRAVFWLIVDGVIAVVLYLMTQGALNLFFEHRFLGNDGLVGRYFREIGWGNATFAQVLALGLTIISIALTAFVIHWYATGAFRGPGRARRVFWPALVMLAAVIVIDMVLFEYRLSVLLYEVDDFRELPSWFVLVGEHLGEWRAWLLLAGVLYPVLGIASGMITQVTWSGLRDDFADWLDSFRGGQTAADAVVPAPAGPAAAVPLPAAPAPALRVQADAPTVGAASGDALPLQRPALRVADPVPQPDGSIGAILRDLERSRDGPQPALPPARAPELQIVPVPRIPPAEPVALPRYRLCPQCRSLVTRGHECEPDPRGTQSKAQQPAEAAEAGRSGR